jgi:predicted esterase
MSRSEVFEVFHVPALVHGRYLVRWPEGPATAVLVGFHGYGERAEDSLAAMERLAEGRPWAVAAIQGLHPFYRRSDQQVVAGWMTRLDRELAIEDNIAYVSRTLATLRGHDPDSGRESGGGNGDRAPHASRSPPRLALAGFSQGVAMTYRAAARCGLPVDAVVALAGDVPPELQGAELPSRPRVLAGRGSEDDWYTAEKLAADLEVLAAMGVRAEGFTFDGGHEWGEAFVERARDVLSETLGA